MLTRALVWSAATFAVGLTGMAGELTAMRCEDIPREAPHDGVMASPAEVSAAAGWALTVFGGLPGSTPGPPVPLDVVRQDFSSLHFGRSCLDTPLRIGTQGYLHGLGTHANSEIHARVPEGAVRFEAFAGIDNNHDTQGTRGSVVFLVEAEAVELARTPVLRGGDAPHRISVELPAGLETLVLKVDTTPDGPSHDQADWAEARFIQANGQAVLLDEGHGTALLTVPAAPFSFQYAGRPSAELLPGWAHTAETVAGEEADTIRASWSDAVTGLRVEAEARVFHRYPAVDWVLHFENAGTAETPLLEDIQALDLALRTTSEKRSVVLGHNRGDVFGETSFENLDSTLEPGKPFRIAPQGGRSSNGAFPFFDLRYGDRTLVGAIGWSGQWALSADRGANQETRLRGGMEHTRLLLRPGERIRSPRILLLLCDADRDTAHNRFRRLLLHHYVPQRDGRPVTLPVVSQCFDRYSWTVPEWATERGQVEAVKTAAALGFEAHWFDAAWFPGGFPNGVGNWFPKPEAFPRGLRPVGEACREHGLGFVLWFEPERVAPGTAIAEQHPEFVHGGKQGGLYRLDDPAARQWMEDRLSERIEEARLDVYRNDFNIDPLTFWRDNDGPERQGMTEIRYVEGLYALWDALLARHPGLLIDNCASGGRRIDLELCMRSVPFWRSDTNCFPGNADWNPGHSAGISAYLPLHMACAWEPRSYEVRAAVTAGLICQWPYRDPDFPADKARALLKEAKSLQKFWYGDLYPLAARPADPQQWGAFQLDRPDLGEGVVMCFRRAASPYTGIEVALRALDPAADYELRWRPEEGDERTEWRAGRALAEGLAIPLDHPASSMVVFYRRR